MKNIVKGIDGPDPPKMGFLASGIQTNKNNWECIKRIPEFKQFLVACFFHRQATAFWATIIVPLLSKPEIAVDQTTFVVCAALLFVSQGIGAPLWLLINKKFNLGCQNIMAINHVILIILCLAV